MTNSTNAVDPGTAFTFSSYWVAVRSTGVLAPKALDVDDCCLRLFGEVGKVLPAREVENLVIHGNLFQY